MHGRTIHPAALESKSKDQKNSEQTAENIFRVANYIKKEIKECKGISAKSI